jgi:hypothetical protein
MARLCIRILSNDHPSDASLTPMRTNLGDVVSVHDDDHVFSFAELNCGHYRIIDLPGVPEMDLLSLVESKKDVDGRMIARRLVGLDTNILKSAPWVGKTTATKTQIDAITVVKV